MKLQDLKIGHFYLWAEAPSYKPVQVRLERVIEREGTGDWDVGAGYPGIEESDGRLEVTVIDTGEKTEVLASQLRPCN